jgi:phage terminase Nu1 subunit (DNA packaging protein)
MNSDSEVLDSWKEIAAFLRRGVRTVQRWETTEGLPVRRHGHMKRGSVYAMRSEVALWIRTRQFGTNAQNNGKNLRGCDQLRGHIAQQRALMGELRLQLARVMATRTQLERHALLADERVRLT